MSNRFKRNALRARSLRVEPLEDRRLLAYAAFAANLYEDVNGTPGDLITDDTIQVGDTFFIEITAQDLLPVPRGLHGISLDFVWDPDVLEEIDSPFDPATIISEDLPAFQYGTLNNEIGKINDLMGNVISMDGNGARVGIDGPDRFALLHFRAEQEASDSIFKIRPGGLGIAHYNSFRNSSADFSFEYQSINIVATETPVEVREETADTPPVANEQPDASMPSEPTQLDSSEQEIAPPVDTTTTNTPSALPDQEPIAAADNESDGGETQAEITTSDPVVEAEPHVLVCVPVGHAGDQTSESRSDPQEITIVYGPLTHESAQQLGNLVVNIDINSTSSETTDARTETTSVVQEAEASTGGTVLPATENLVVTIGPREAASQTNAADVRVPLGFWQKLEDVLDVLANQWLQSS